MAFDLKMEVYTPALELVGMLNEWKSVIWEEKAFTAGSFSLDSIISSETRELLVKENIIWIEGESAGIIEHIEQRADDTGPYITVKGRMLTGILDRRILWGLYNLSGPPAAIMHRLVDDCAINPTRGNTEARIIHGLVSREIPSGGASIQVQMTGDTLLERLETLGRTYGVAFGVAFNAAVPRMEFWTRYGTDRSVNQTDNDPVFYSTELDDVLASEYTYDSSQYRNVALVAGEGEGDERKMIVVEESMPETPMPPTPPEPPAGGTYTVTLLIDPEGGGTATGGQTVAAGTRITVTASPSEGYTFTEWRENGAMVSTSAKYSFTVNSDRTLTAVFAVEVKKYTITATVDPSGSGKVTGAGAYNEGATVNLVATANEGYNFTDWKENGETVYNEPEYSFQAEKDRDLVAAFIEKKPSRLPDGYTEVEYIQSDGNQYIDTGVIPTNQVKIEMDVEPTVDPLSTYLYFFASLYSVTSLTYYLVFRAAWISSGVVGSMGSYQRSTGITATVLSSDTTPRRIFVTMDASKRTASAGDGTKSFSSNAFNTSMPDIRLLGTQSGTGSLPAKLYSCKIYKGSSLERDYVPCKSASDGVGLYELVDGKFYGNIGSGNFTAGPSV